MGQSEPRFIILLMFLIILFNCFLQCAQAAADPHFEEELPTREDVDPHNIWNYELQELWSREFPACASNRQSPINIDTSRVVYDPNYKLDFINYSQNITLRLKNTHHTVNFDPMQLNEFPMVQPSWAPEGSQYELHDIHFHWGARTEPSCGSEHRVDNKTSPSEVHFVHFLKGLTKDEALARPNSIVVIGVFIDEATSAWDRNYNAQFDEAISYFPLISGDTKAEYFDLPFEFDPYKFLPAKKYRFYAYNGSLTTPACSEVVQWVVMDQHVSISRSTLDILRDMKTAIPNELVHEIGANFREVQDLNAREVIATFEPRRKSVFTFPISSVRVFFEGLRGLRSTQASPIRVHAGIDDNASSSGATVVKTNELKQVGASSLVASDGNYVELVDEDEDADAESIATHEARWATSLGTD